MKLHYLQHVPFEDPGTVLTWAEKNDCRVTSTRLYEDENLPTHSDYDWLVVMGGPMNIYDEKNYPWLVQEKSFIREAIDSGKIIIGLCLGAQLIAEVIGGNVTENTYQEIGWFPVKLSNRARSSSLFSFFPQEPMVFQWHGDTFSKLPDDAICIAENEACSHQAFIYKNRVFGFQFHLENTEEIIKDLLKNCEDEMVPGAYVQTPTEILSHPEYIEQGNQWMDMFLTKLKKWIEDGVNTMNQIRYVQRDCKDTAKIDNFLSGTRIGVIGMNGDDFPYAVPVNYVWSDGSLFFHGMGSGKKETILSAEPLICFTVYEEYGTVKDPMPCHADTAYMSVMLFGRVEKVNDFKEAASALQNLIEKYTPGYYKKPLTSKLVEKYKSSFDGNTVSVYRLTPTSITAKENQSSENELFKEK